jgi:hypothetical protein
MMHRNLAIILPEEWDLCMASHGAVGMFTVKCRYG